MSVLHQIFSATPAVLQQVVSLAASDDCILLLGDGCYLAGTACDDRIRARSVDAEVRGLHLPVHTAALTDDEWVSLTLSCSKTLSWF